MRRIVPASRSMAFIMCDRVHPERFVRQAPKPVSVPTEVWINKPLNADENAH